MIQVLSLNPDDAATKKELIKLNKLFRDEDEAVRKKFSGMFSEK
jgi:hypothetical protein